MGEAFTPGPWYRCHHLQSAEKDASCPCGYRGGIWCSDQEHIICEMGGTVVEGQEGLSPRRYDRATELANARLIAAAPMMFEALKWISEHYGNQDMGHKDFRVEAAIRAEEAIVAATHPDGDPT